jgi:hypothetical protein
MKSQDDGLIAAIGLGDLIVTLSPDANSFRLHLYYVPGSFDSAGIFSNLMSCWSNVASPLYSFGSVKE